MLDKLFFISLILSITGLFRFVAPPLGVSIGQISLALMIFNLFYLVNRLSYLRALSLQIFPWFILLIAWPLATVIYAPVIDVRLIGLLVNGFILFAGAAVYTMSKGPLAIYRVFLVALLVTFFGIGLNMVTPDLFENVAQLADARTLSLNRPGGFFMQPNSLALGMAFMFIGWLAFAKRNTIFFESFAIVVFLEFVLLTGSRTGMIIVLFIIVLHFGFELYNSLFSLQKIRKFLTRFAIFVVFFIFGFIGMKIFIGFYRDIVEVTYKGLIERISNMLEFRLGDIGVNVLQDSSVLARADAQILFLQLIKEKPIFGHGFGAETAYLDAGTIYLSSHSTILTSALEYGVFYPMFALILLVKLFFNKNRRLIEKTLGTNIIMQFLAVTMLLFAYGGGLFGDRVFMIVLGVVFALSSAPSYVFRQPGAKSINHSDKFLSVIK